ncbi:hypothetical protein D3C72_617000 [compost metagenome]
MAPDGGQGQRLGGAVRRVNLGVGVEHLAEPLDDRGRHGRAHRDDAFERLELLVVQRAVAADPVEQGRRAEHPGGAEPLDGPEDHRRVDLARLGEVHLRDDHGGAQRHAEEREEREGVQEAVIRPLVEEVADEGRLHLKRAVGVKRAFGHAGAAAGEEDRGHFVGGGVGRGKRRLQAGGLEEFVPAPEELAPHGDGELGLGCPLEDHAGEVGLGHPDEGLGLGLVQAGLEVGDAHAGVYEDGHRADLEEREGDGEEIDAHRHHERHAHAAPHAEAGQRVGVAVRQGVEHPEADDGLPRDDGVLVGMGRCHLGEPSGDVGDVGGRAHDAGVALGRAWLAGWWEKKALTVGAKVTGLVVLAIAT